MGAFLLGWFLFMVTITTAAMVLCAIDCKDIEFGLFAGFLLTGAIICDIIFMWRVF